MFTLTFASQIHMSCPPKVKYEKNNSEQLCFVAAAHQEQSKRIVFCTCCLWPENFLFLIFNCFEVASCLREVSQEPTYHFVLRESIDHQYDMIDQIHSTEKPESPFQIELEMSESASCSGSSSKPNRSSRFSRISKALSSTQCLDWAKRGQLD